MEDLGVMRVSARTVLDLADLACVRRQLDAVADAKIGRGAAQVLAEEEPADGDYADDDQERKAPAETDR